MVSSSEGPAQLAAPGFYRGFLPSLLLCSHGAILLVAYDRCKRRFESVLVASFTAKVFASVATYPLQDSSTFNRFQWIFMHVRDLIGILWAFYGHFWCFNAFKGYFKYFRWCAP